MDTTLTGKITEHIREFYVVFSNSPNVPKLLRPFVRNGFEHCFLLVATAHGSMRITQTLYNVEFITYDCHVSLLAQAYVEEPDHTVVYYPMFQDFEPVKTKIAYFIPTCVSLCQRIMGVEFNAFTPYQLYRGLTNEKEGRCGKSLPRLP